MESNRLYYARRAAQEQRAAQRAITPQARAWHNELAEDFARRAREFSGLAAEAI